MRGFIGRTQVAITSPPTGGGGADNAERSAWIIQASAITYEISDDDERVIILRISEEKKVGGLRRVKTEPVEKDEELNQKEVEEGQKKETGSANRVTTINEVDEDEGGSRGDDEGDDGRNAGKQPAVIKSISLWLPSNDAGGSKNADPTGDDGASSSSSSTINIRRNHCRRRMRKREACSSSSSGVRVYGTSPHHKKSNSNSKIRKCAIEGCTNFSQSRVRAGDQFGPPGHRCKRHGGGYKCSIAGCTSWSQGTVRVPDIMGPPGFRCSRHGGGNRCTIKDCMNKAQSRIKITDAFGAPGPRCCRHGGGLRCEVPGCKNFKQCRVPVGDKYGPPGIRCKRHGGGYYSRNYTRTRDVRGRPSTRNSTTTVLLADGTRRNQNAMCAIEGCTKFSQSRVRAADQFGPPGNRCKRHGGGYRCSAPGCNNWSQGRVHVQDRWGHPGSRCLSHGGGPKCVVHGCGKKAQSSLLVGSPLLDPSDHPMRCVKHGGRNKCVVPGCMSLKQSTVQVPDAFGAPGNRCKRHGGGVRCSVTECMKHPQGKVFEEDAFGGPGPRCRRHGGGYTRIIIKQEESVEIGNERRRVRRV